MFPQLSRLWARHSRSCWAQWALHNCLCRCNLSSVLTVLSLLGEIIPFLLLSLLGAQQTLLYLFQLCHRLYQVTTERRWSSTSPENVIFLFCLSPGWEFCPLIYSLSTTLQLKLGKTLQFAMIKVVFLSSYKEKKLLMLAPTTSQDF